MAILIPIWFFEFSFAMHFIATLIGIMLSYFSFRLFRYTQRRTHLLLTLAFIFITIGFAVIAVSNIDSLFHFENCEAGCTIYSLNPVFNWIIYGNYAYYITSLASYFLFALSYFEICKTKTGKKKKIASTFLQVISTTFLFNPQPQSVLFPFEPAFFQPFHAISAIILFAIVLQTYSIYRKNKLRLSLLVVLAFVAILFYHILMFAIPFSPMFFALAHISLLLGFGSLLFMLIKVNK